MSGALSCVAKSCSVHGWFGLCHWHIIVVGHCRPPRFYVIVSFHFLCLHHLACLAPEHVTSNQCCGFFWLVKDSPVSSLCLCLSLSLRFNGHFADEPGLAGVYWSKGWWRWWWQLDYWSYKSCKATVKSSPPTNQHPAFCTGRIPFLSPNQQCQSTEGKISHSMNLLTPSSPGCLSTLSLTTNSSWLLWGRVAMPLISPLMTLSTPTMC